MLGPGPGLQLKPIHPFPEAHDVGCVVPAVPCIQGDELPYGKFALVDGMEKSAVPIGGGYILQQYDHAPVEGVEQCNGDIYRNQLCIG